ncbi:unnamed protein product [Zymoseptoria tritici ST99CH_1E4]|uniref:Uncharacterized protein n=1 Tax=Zymoseptoria tritici ST99CH_1E4 TaxID=1276532 RepID=A0A2H1H9X9_ZYMTR|nr:unnamed protein product [Zymoseptoria tritici ST99CH_1E4]
MDLAELRAVRHRALVTPHSNSWEPEHCTCTSVNGGPLASRPYFTLHEGEGDICVYHNIPVLQAPSDAPPSRDNVRHGLGQDRSIRICPHVAVTDNEVLDSFEQSDFWDYDSAIHPEMGGDKCAVCEAKWSFSPESSAAAHMHGRNVGVRPIFPTLLIIKRLGTLQFRDKSQRLQYAHHLSPDDIGGPLF